MDWDWDLCKMDMVSKLVSWWFWFWLVCFSSTDVDWKEYRLGLREERGLRDLILFCQKKGIGREFGDLDGG